MEKVAALQTARYFEDRKAQVNFKAFEKIMRRRSGKPPRDGDEIPLESCGKKEVPSETQTLKKESPRLPATPLVPGFGVVVIGKIPSCSCLELPIDDMR
jgi:hypothetical protein